MPDKSAPAPKELGSFIIKPVFHYHPAVLQVGMSESEISAAIREAFAAAAEEVARLYVATMVEELLYGTAAARAAPMLGYMPEAEVDA